MPSEIEAARLRELFTAASELETAERRCFLDEACAGQPDLRGAIEKLLQADSAAESNLIWRRSALQSEARQSAPDQRLPFESLGPYRILERIGSGGMGVVYLAEGDYDGVRKRVAIKAMPYAFDQEMVRRFQRERQIVASLEHPNIARMVDAGTTPDGVPYLVMEYVDGIPLSQYASERRLSVNARLSLFRTVCEAVAYAHRNLIVHRDLKPGNILVTADGVPKLLDFGIARLVADPEATGMAAFTPAYASPEQLAGRPISTASDIYSLGVILQQLVTGEKPGDRRRLDGDMENVVSMALREEPQRRYSSAADFAEDVRRVMEHYPVLARPDTPGYRMRKFVSRRPVETVVVLALAASLMVAGAVAVHQYREATRRFNDVRAIANSFLFEVYDSIGDLPGATKTRMVVAKRAEQYLEVLARGRASDRRLNRELAASYRRLGDILGAPTRPNLGDSEGALANYRKAAGLLEGILAATPDDPGVLSDLGEVYRLEGRIDMRRRAPDDALAADELSRRMLERAAALQPSSREARMAAINASLDAALVHLGLGGDRVDVSHVKAAEELALQAKSAAEKLMAEAPDDESSQVLACKAYEYLAFAERDVGVAIGDRDRLVRSAHSQEARLALTKSIYSRNPDKYLRYLADAHVEASEAWLALGETHQSETTAREGLRLSEEIAASDPNNREAIIDVNSARWALGRALDAGHKGAEAASQFQKIVATEEQLPQSRQDTPTLKLFIDVRNHLAAYYLSLGKNAEAVAQYQVNISSLGSPSAPELMLVLAVEDGLLGDALARKEQGRAASLYSEAVGLFEALRNSHQLPLPYAGAAAELRTKLTR